MIHQFMIENLSENFHEEIIGKVYKTGSGYYYRVEDYGFQKRFEIYYQVKFMETGHICFATYKQIKSGGIKDPYMPTVFKNQCSIGEIDHNYPNLQRLRTRWEKMFERVMNEDNDSYKRYGLYGLSIDPTWFCFENYINDITSQKGFHPTLLCEDNFIQLDKDYLQLDKEKKKDLQYGPYTCLWLLTEINAGMVKRDSYRVKLTSPKGKEYHGYDIEDLKKKVKKSSKMIAQKLDAMMAKIEKDKRRKKTNNSGWMLETINR